MFREYINIDTTAIFKINILHGNPPDDESLINDFYHKKALLWRRSFITYKQV